MGGSRNAAAQTGRQAFERAQISSKLADSKSLEEADAVAATQSANLARDRAPASKRVAGRLFIQREKVWTDVGQADRITVTDIAAYSRAYFELVRLLPEVAPYLSVGDEVLIAGRRESIRIRATGVEVWRPGQLAELVRNFRGT